MVKETRKRYLTIRQTVAQGILNEHRLRCMVKQGQLPGFYDGYHGTRFLIDVDALERQLRAASINGGTIDEN